MPCIGLLEVPSSLKQLQADLYSEVGVICKDKLSDVMIRDLLAEPGKLMWKHQGQCNCGRKTYLFHHCMQCAREERQAQHWDAMEEWLDRPEESKEDGNLPPK